MLHDQIFTGNLTKDPVLRTGKNGKPFVQFALALDDQKGTQYEKTHFPPFTASGKLAENLAASVKKGTPMIVIARLDSYTKDVVIDGKEVGLNQITFRVMQAGPSLAFATAEVSKNPFDDDNRGSGQRGKAPKADEADTPAPDRKPVPAASAAGDVSDDF